MIFDFFGGKVPAGPKKLCPAGILRITGISGPPVPGMLATLPADVLPPDAYSARRITFRLLFSFITEIYPSSDQLTLCSFSILSTISNADSSTIFALGNNANISFFLLFDNRRLAAKAACT